MKLVILHLSDTHFRKSKGENPVVSRVDKIAAAAASVAPDAECCFLAATGDISHSGKEAEYVVTATFLADLLDELRRRLPDSEWRFVSVPGNHDCNLSKSNKVRETILRNLSTDDFEEDVFATCTAVQRDYEEFAASLREPTAQYHRPSKVYAEELHEVKGATVEFRLINSAWMSTMEESQGTLLFPVDLLGTGRTGDPPADLVVTMLHHPDNWFEARNARSLRDELEATSDVILTGHEHEAEQYTKTRVTGERTEYLEGAVLQTPDHPEMSEFNVLVIDLNAESQELHVFSWDSARRRYHPSRTSARIPFQRNRRRLEKEFELTKTFEEFLSDAGANFTHPEKETIHLKDLFVYPDLLHLKLPGEGEWPRAVVGDVPTFVLNHGHVLLVGSEWCGKTALCRTLFRDLRKTGLVPIYVSGEQLKGYTQSSVLQAVDRAFLNAYASPDADGFRQLERERKAVIVDDFDQATVNRRARDLIIRTLESIFGVIVLVGNEALRFDDVVAYTEGEEPPLWHYSQCAILPHGHVRRADLIEKWTFLGRSLTGDESELSRRAVEAERTVSLLLGQNFLPAYPIFILVLLQQMEARTPLTTVPTSGSYGALYECLLTMALVRSSRLEVDLDTQYGYLSEFAHFLFTRGESCAPTLDTLEWHRRHCEDYGVHLDFDRMLSDLCEACVLSSTQDAVGFRYPYLYYYFVARYFSEHIQEPAIREHVESMSKRLHHAQSANILMFLTYLSKDPFILGSILRASRSLFSSYVECDLVRDTDFLSALMMKLPQLVLESSDPAESRRKLLARRDELEAADAPGQLSDAWDDQPPGLHEDLEEHLQINVAFKTIQILGQILRNFPGSLKGQRKLELAGECYSLGLRVIRFMFESMESLDEDLVHFIADFLRSRNPRWSDDQLSSHTKNFLSTLADALAFIVVKQVSDSVGDQKLSITFRDLLGERDTISYRFIDLSVQLDYYHGFPESHVFKLYKRVGRNPFAAYLLRHLVWYYFYIYPADYSLRQSVCTKLDIKLLPAVHDQRVKRPKR